MEAKNLAIAIYKLNLILIPFGQLQLSNVNICGLAKIYELCQKDLSFSGDQSLASYSYSF